MYTPLSNSIVFGKGVFFCLVFLFANIVSARELNYMQSHLFRLSDTNSTDEWILPIKKYDRNSFPTFRFDTLAAADTDAPNLINDIRKKRKQKIVSDIDENLGDPYEAAAQMGISYRIDRYIQGFTTTMAATAIANDPVFPEVELLFYQSHLASSSFIYQKDKNFFIIPRLSYGIRRVLDRNYTTGELIDKKPNTKIKEEPWNFIVTAGADSEYRLEAFNLLASIESVPIVSDGYNYYDCRIGISTKNLFAEPNTPIDWNIYAIFSPIYAGDYDIKRTGKLGTQFRLYNTWEFDLFAEDNFHIGSMLKLTLRYFELSLFTFERSYDEYGLQDSRSYGLHLSAKF